MQRHAALTTALLVVLVFTGSCRKSSPGYHHRAGQGNAPTAHAHQYLAGEDRLAATRGPRVETVRTQPMMRIRVARALKAATITGGTSVTVGPGGADLGKARSYTFQTPLRITHDGQGFVLAEPTGKQLRWRLGTLSVAGYGNRVTLNDAPFPGSINLVAQRSKTGQPAGFDAVNHVGMEAYLPGVLSKELYPGWDPEAYRAQAIAARSYAIWEMQLPVRRNSHFDLEASEASQAYVGDKASPKARAAVAATAGQVLVYNGRVLPAFYSSCTGGAGQDAAAAWPGKVDNLAPLRGRNHGGWGQQSSKFRWGPVNMTTADLIAALQRWGRGNKHAIANLSGLRSITPSANNAAGRPTRFVVVDTNGRRYELFAEDLRVATNTALPGNAHKVKAKVFSSFATYTIIGNRTTITGRGFGHGVGMCQFGAQHMATQRHNHRAILGFYYPGASLQKTY